MASQTTVFKGSTAIEAISRTHHLHFFAWYQTSWLSFQLGRFCKVSIQLTSRFCKGLVASGSILIEKKTRRSELALYVMPRAVDSFVLGLMKRRWVLSFKFGEVLLFSLCMGGLMYFRYFKAPIPG